MSTLTSVLQTIKKDLQRLELLLFMNGVVLGLNIGECVQITWVNKETGESGAVKGIGVVETGKNASGETVTVVTLYTGVSSGIVTNVLGIDDAKTVLTQIEEVLGCNKMIGTSPDKLELDPSKSDGVVFSVKTAGGFEVSSLQLVVFARKTGQITMVFKPAPAEQSSQGTGG